jgi:hypothetical protein
MYYLSMFVSDQASVYDKYYIELQSVAIMQ